MVRFASCPGRRRYRGVVLCSRVIKCCRSRFQWSYFLVRNECFAGKSCELADACSSNLIESILSTATSSVIGAFGVSAFALGCSLAVSCFRDGEPFGAGDVKLLFPIGLFAGFEGGIAALCVACVASLLYCAARLAVGRPVRDFPFAPFLAIGFLAVSGIVPIFLGGAPL